MNEPPEEKPDPGDGLGDADRARQLANRLLSRASRRGKNGEVTIPAVVACESTYRNLIRTVGRTGAYAILSRALAQTQERYPALRELRFERNLEQVLGDVGALVQVHGVAAVSEALHALLVAAFVVLGRMVGPDMASQLVEQGMTIGTREDEDTI